MEVVLHLLYPAVEATNLHCFKLENGESSSVSNVIPSHSPHHMHGDHGFCWWFTCFGGMGFKDTGKAQFLQSSFAKKIISIPRLKCRKCWPGHLLLPFFVIYKTSSEIRGKKWKQLAWPRFPRPKCENFARPIFSTIS